MNNILKSTLIICALPLLALPANAAEIDPDSIEIGAEARSYPFGDFCFATITFEARAETDDQNGRDYFYFVIEDPERKQPGTTGNFGAVRFDVFSAFDDYLPIYHLGPHTLQFFDKDSPANQDQRDDPISEAIEFPRDVLLAAGGICAEMANYASNTAPIAHAGDDVTGAIPNKLIYLDGSLSSDEDLDDLTFNWRQVSGPAVDLFDSDTDRPYFFYPPGRASQVIKFEMTVYDGTDSSEPDMVEVIHNGRSNGKAKGRNK